jgi:hypothetical protein
VSVDQISPDDDRLTWEEEHALNCAERAATMAFAKERAARIYRLHQQGLTPKQIARHVGGLAPYRVKHIIAQTERHQGTPA